jgi:thymidylate kinase
MGRYKYQEGKIIAVEGCDGSGKSTQAKLIVDLLTKEQDRPVKLVKFPQYDTKSGQLIDMLLKGQIPEQTPYTTAMLFASNKREMAETMAQWRSLGNIVVVDRYVCSNMAYQGARSLELDTFNKNNYRASSRHIEMIDYICQLEYGLNKMPVEDYVVYLQPIPDVAATRLKTRVAKIPQLDVTGKPIPSLPKIMDLDTYEQDKSLQDRVRWVYGQLREMSKHVNGPVYTGQNVRPVKWITYVDEGQWKPEVVCYRIAERLLGPEFMDIERGEILIY